MRRVALVVSILTLSSSAWTQPSTQPPLDVPGVSAADPEVVATNPEVVVTSYRNHVLITSGIGIGGLLGGVMLERESGDNTAADFVFALGLTTTFIASPFVHAVHGELGRTAASFGLRLGAAFIGGAVGLEVGPCPTVENDECQIGMFARGALVGVVVGSIVEAFTLTTQRHYVTRSTNVAPVFSASPSGGHIGLAGTF